MVNLVGSSGVCALAGLAQLVEQLFRKQQVRGSSPRVGSEQPDETQFRAEVAKWQTRYVQGVVPVREWRFKSSPGHF